MTPRENLMVTRLVNRLVGQADLPKDADAEFELAMLLKTRADAPYLLLRRCLILEVSLAQVGDELNALRAAPGAGVLREAPSVVAAPTPAFAPSSMQSVQSTPPMQPAQTSAQPNSFLRNAATIGAGVLGGSLLFQGVESLLHGSGGRGLLGGSGSGAADNFIAPPPSPAEATASGSLDAASNGLSTDDGDVYTDDDGSWA